MKRREIAQTLIASALIPSSSTAQARTAPHYAQTSEEIAAGVTPIDFSFRELNILRYGAPVNSGDAAAAIKVAIAVLRHHVGAELLIPAGYTFNLSQVVFSSLSKFNLRCDGVVVSAAALPVELPLSNRTRRGLKTADELTG